MEQEKSLLYGKRGQRKQRANFSTMVFLLAGFGIAAWLKVDFQLYLCYAAGCLGANTAFMWGNVQATKATAGATVNPLSLAAPKP